MKLAEIEAIWDDLAGLCELESGSHYTRALRDFQPLFKEHPQQTVASFVKKIHALSNIQSSSRGVLVGDLHELLTRFRKLAEKISRKTIVADLDRILDVLKEHKAHSVLDFVTAAREELSKKPAARKPRAATAINESVVRQFVERLESSYTDETQFYDVLDALKSDKRVRRAELVAIASKFRSPLAKSTTAKKALEHIEAKHKYWMRAEHMSKGMAGRTAA